MTAFSSSAHLLLEFFLVLVLITGLVLGFMRAWWFALLGVVVPVALGVGSRFASNNTLPGSEDMSWRILLLVVAAEGAALFFGSFAVGAGVRTLVDSCIVEPLGHPPTSATDPSRMLCADRERTRLHLQALRHGREPGSPPQPKYPTAATTRTMRARPATPG